MNQIKSIIKKFVGKPSEPMVTIDTVAQTNGLFCIIGWYGVDRVDYVSLVDSEDNELDVQIDYIERTDVEHIIGKPAKGFQLTLKTTLSVDDIRLVVVDVNASKTYLQLSLKGVAPFIEDKKEVVSKSTGTIKGNCEIVLLGEKVIFLSGWLLSNTPLRNAEIQSDGKTFGVVSRYMRYHREDVKNAFPNEKYNKNTGFMIFMDREEISSSSLQLELSVFEDGIKSIIPVEQNFVAHMDKMLNAKRLLNNWYPHIESNLKESQHFLAMLREIYRNEELPSVTRYDFGNSVEQPRASIIIPLYGRYDFMRYQLARFSTNKQTQDCEILYVVDDPSIAKQSYQLAKQMETITSQSFSLLELEHNVGFGLANNIGVEHASGEFVVLLNSDALPKSDDWLDKLISTAEEPNAGIVGARLLFEDESIQHDGMAPMLVQEYPGLIFNDHPRKGWPKSLCPVEQSVEPCKLVTAACWVLKRKDFIKLGGFDSKYVLGDFEDSDFCLRMLAENKTNYLRRDVELYHLERQSQNLVEPGRWKHNITILNAIQFNDAWNQKLKDLEEVVNND